ncbi:MAG: hypothetical protein ABEJ88_03260 [Halobacterium sp.]
MSLPDQLERVGIVLGSMLMFSLPASLVLQVAVGPGTPWWGLVVLLAPGFVVGWAVAAGQAPFDYDSVWFVCFFGYVLALGAVVALEVQPPWEHELVVLGVSAAAFAAAAAVDYYR